MRHLKGSPRNQSQLLPPSVEDYVPADHPIRVIDAFVDALDLVELGFRKAHTAATGWKPYHPGDLLKLFIYAYLNQTSSTRRLEKECHRNLEVFWLMKQLVPDFKTIADFRKDNGPAIKKTCRHFIVFCKQAGLISGDLVAVDGSKFKAVASKDQAITRKQLQTQLAKLDQKIGRYMDQLAQSESAHALDLNNQQVACALDYLQQHKVQLQHELQALDSLGKSQHCRTEPDAKLMKSGREGVVLGYNAQNAVDSQHQLIVHHELTQAGTDNQQLEPMSKATKDILGDNLETVVADAGYSNGEQVANVQAESIDVAVPANRAINNQNRGQMYQKSDFTYLPDQDVYRCPAGELLKHTTISSASKIHLYSRSGCNQCSLQRYCTNADKRWISRHFHEQALDEATSRATPALMARRMAIVEPTFGTLKRLLNRGRFTCWGLASASSEYSLGVLSYNLVRAINVLGVKRLLAQLA